MRKFLYLPGLAVLMIGLFCGSSATTERKPAVAGTFYPAGKAELQAMIDSHLAKVSGLPEIDGQIIALLVPHAGLVYSGQIAAYAYRLLDGADVSKVILCGPSHRYRFDGISVYGPNVSWPTPLGVVPCETGLSSQLLKFHDAIKVIPEAHTQEHCLEVQLPYLQTVLEDFEIVPVIMGFPGENTIALLANALESLPFDDNTIMVASTDWQHYRPATEGWVKDSVGIECLKNLDPISLERYLREGKVEMCGGGVAVSVMKAAIARGANHVKILKYGDSGDITGDKSSVVSYVAAVMYKSPDRKKNEKESPSGSLKEENLPPEFELTEKDKKTLLEVAREALTTYLTSRTVPDFEVSDNLRELGAAFVTLEKGGRLRGCIGHTTAVEPLYKTVSTCAIQAAVADPRFPPVQDEELDQLHIEISVLTPMQKVESLDEIEVGRDGLMIFKGSNRGLLLPQVATDYGWDRTTFLEQTCHKAGLAPNAYMAPDAVIYKFQAVIFGE
jgi:AmmeMemoRadiSam system protein B/AmmeMemoRadiSam system protein A